MHLADASPGGRYGEQRSYRPDGNSRRDLLDRYCAEGKDALDAKEYRSLLASNSESGGYLTLGEILSGEFIRGITDQTFMMQKARIFKLSNAQSLGTPSLGTAMSAPSWASEISEAPEDTSMKFAKRSLTPHPLTNLLKVSNTLLRLGTPAPSSVVESEMMIRFAEEIERTCMVGHGAQQPLGIFAVSENGINTDRDCSTGNSATAIVANNLFYCEEMLKAGHRKNACWIFSRGAVRRLRMLKDGSG